MFSYLHGTLAQKNPAQVVIDVGGVGYEVTIPLSTYRLLSDKGSRVMLLTHVHIREDAHQIYGFSSEEERNFFRLLIGVSGIGPKMALTVLSGLALDDLKHAIIHEDLARLTAISGIGRKTAERIIIELRENVFLDEKSAARKPLQDADEGLIQDTLLVLVSLGYKKQSAQDAIKKVLSQASRERREISVEELVRASLKVI